MHTFMCISTPGTEWLVPPQRQPVEGRFKSCVVQAEACLLACMRYIELKPARAGSEVLAGGLGSDTLAGDADGIPIEFQGSAWLDGSDNWFMGAIALKSRERKSRRWQHAELRTSRREYATNYTLWRRAA